MLEAPLNKDSLNVDSEDEILDILITIATKLLELLRNNINSLKLPKIIKNTLRKLKSFIVKDNENKNDSKNSAEPETSSGQGEGKSEASSSS